MNREVLERQFDDSQLKTKTGTFGKQVSYIEGAAVIARLNEAFDGNWSFEVVEYKVFEDEIVVLGKLTADGIIKSQFGSTKITRNRDTQEYVSLGDDIKSATTDNIKKCATLLGVGLYLYGGGDSGNGSNGGAKPKPENNAKDSGNGSNGRLTNKQLQAIYSIGKSRNMTQKAIKDYCVEMFQKTPDFLDKSQASQIIKELQQK